MSSTLKKTLKGSATIFGMNTLSLFVSLAVTVVLVTSLPLKDYGLFILALSAYNFFKLFPNMGLGRTVVSEIARYKGAGEFGKVKKILKEYAKFEITTSAVIMVLVFFLAESIAEVYSPKIVELLRLIAVMLFFFGIRDILQTTMQGYSKFLMYSSIPFVEAIARLVMVYIFVLHLQGGIYWAMISYMVGICASSLVLFIYYMKSLKTLKNAKEVEEGLFWDMFKSYGKYAPLNGMVKKLRDNAPEWIINWFWDLETVAIFGFAKKFYTPLKQGFAAVENVLLPTMSEEIKKDKKKFHTIYQRGTKYAFWASCIIVIPAILLAPVVVDLVAPGEYGGSVPVLQVLFIGLIIAGVSNSQKSTLFALGSQKHLFIATSVALIALIVSALPLALYYGAVGMAVAMIIRNLAGMVSRSLMLRREGKELTITIKDLFVIDNYDRETFSRIFRKANSFVK